jgi:hypothetical protein
MDVPVRANTRQSVRNDNDAGLQEKGELFSTVFPLDIM